MYYVNAQLLLQRNDRKLTKLGHILSDPELRSIDPSPQRDLSPLSNCIMRLLVNATCVWIASSNNEVSTSVILIRYKILLIRVLCRNHVKSFLMLLL